MLNLVEQEKLKKLKISEERFHRESQALLNLGYAQEDIKKLILLNIFFNKLTFISLNIYFLNIF